MSQARQLQDDIEETLAACEFTERDLFAVRLALEEALVNAVKHGNQLDPQKRVHVRYSVFGDEFKVVIRDEGPGFNPDDVPDPTAPENIERPCGRGLLLIRRFMTTVDYSAAGTTLTMTKRRSPADPH